MDWPKNEIPYRQGLGFAMIPIGSLISLIIVMWKFSHSRRRALLILADVLTIIGAVLTTFDIFSIFLIGRLFLGLSAGINALIAPIYLRELSPKEISGKMCSSCGIGASTGKFLGFVLAFGLPIPPDSKNIYCKFMYFFPVFFSAARIIFLCFFFQFETAKYYLLNRKPQKAKELINFIFKTEYAEEALESVVDEVSNQKTITLETLKTSFPMQMIICTMLVALMQLTGLHTLTAYSTAILTGSLVNETLNANQLHYVNVINFWMGIIRIVASSFAGFLLDKVGRRGLLILGPAIQAGSLIILAISTQIHSMQLGGAMILVFSIGVPIGFGTTAPVYLSELLPAKGCSFMLLIDNSMNLLLNSTFPLLVSIEGFGFAGTLYLMSGITIVGVIAIMKLVVETKGLSMRGIYQMFKDLRGDTSKTPMARDSEKRRLLEWSQFDDE